MSRDRNTTRNVGVVEKEGKLSEGGGKLIQALARLKFKASNCATAGVLIFKEIQLRYWVVEGGLFEWSLEVLVEKTERQDFPSARKPLHTEVIVVGLGKLKIRISEKVAVIGEVFGDHGTHFFK